MTFKGLVKDPRDVQAPEGSINAALLALPQQREYTHDMQGRVLLFPRTGIIGVPFRMHKDSWSVVVVDGSACVKENGVESYPRGGYHIDVSNLEMQTAIELDTNRADYAPRAEDWVEGQARDRDRLTQILWRSAMPGWAPINPEHPDWAFYLQRAEEIIENPFGDAKALDRGTVEAIYLVMITLAGMSNEEAERIIRAAEAAGRMVTS